MVLCPAAAALRAEFTVYPNGTAYLASVEVPDASEFMFIEQGMLGERVPFEVSGIHVTNESGEVTYEKTGSQITFPQGDYAIAYQGIIRDKRLHAEFTTPYDILVILPPELDVRNPLLGAVSAGGAVKEDNGNVTIHWEETQIMECRFYDAVQEQALLIFGTFWLALCAIFIVPYLILWNRDRRKT